MADAMSPSTKNVSVKLPSTNAIASLIALSRMQPDRVLHWSQRRPQETQHLRGGLGAVAARLLHRLARPEMPRSGDDDAAREEAGLLESGQEDLRLGLRVDDVVVGAVNEEKARPGLFVLFDGGVARRRGIEIGAAVLHRRDAEEFFGNLVARPGDLVVQPLRLHVVDAVKADH